MAGESWFLKVANVLSQFAGRASTFVGAVGLSKIARFRLDPRDARTDAEYYELVGDDDGVFGCMSLLGCQDVCPKDLPLQARIAYVRRQMAKQGFTRG